MKNNEIEKKVGKHIMRMNVKTKTLYIWIPGENVWGRITRNKGYYDTFKKMWDSAK